MRNGISISVSSADRRRLEAIVRGRNTPQKHVWRARIVLLSADGVGTNAVYDSDWHGEDDRTPRVYGTISQAGRWGY